MIKFILDKDMLFKAASPLLIFAKGLEINGFSVVHPDLENDEEIRRILSNTFDIKPLETDTLLSLLDTIFSSALVTDNKLNKLAWNYLNYLNKSDLIKYSEWILNHLYCKCCDKNWKSVNEALLPGAVFDQPYYDEIKQFVIDTEFHSDDLHIMKALGISDMPTRVGMSTVTTSKYWNDKKYQLYRSFDEFSGKNTHWNLLSLKCEYFPHNIEILPKTTNLINSKITKCLIELILSDKISRLAIVQHDNHNQYHPLEVHNPVFWFLLKYGTVNINGVAVSLGYTYMRRDDQFIYDRLYHTDVYNFFDLIEFDDIPLEYLQEHGDWSLSASNTKKFWLSIFETYGQDDQFHNPDLIALLHAMTECEVFPNRFFDGEVPYHISELYVTSSAQLANKVRPHLKNVLHLRSDLINAWVSKGAKKLESLLSVKWNEGSYYGPDTVENTIPVLLDVLNPEDRSLKVALVDNLHYAFEGTRISLSCLLRSDELLIDRSSNDFQSGRVDLYDSILRELDGAKLLNRSLNDARRTVININADKIIKKVAGIDQPEDKLITLVGEDKNSLLNALPWGADQSHIQNLDLKSISKVVLTTLGPTLLQDIHIKEAMERQGLIVPAQWGTLNASNFVLSLGFPSEYAASKTGRRDPEEWVDGPFILPKLHDFQEEVFGGIKKLVESDQPRKRAVVSLPTGGGKTRVTVEAVIRLVMAPKPANNLVIWVAQTDELCEQAIVAFRQVWVNFGSQNKQLRLIRFWGGHQNPTPSSGNEDNPTVIVASIQTLFNRIDADGTEWIKEANVLVLDECHHAITSSYTKLLKWLDSDSTIRSVNIENEPMIIGLSATPFRVDDDESERLANRFDRRWFPSNQEHLYKKLIKDEVLSSARQEALLSNVELTDIELKKIEDLANNLFGPSLENLLNSINERLANDKKRNSLIVSKVKNSDSKSILLFANSVQHAKELAVRLTSQGIPAVAISGDTPKTARRYFLNQYQRGEIKVLCNFNVLTTGFDAPRTDMVLISRQIMSPVRYMQIVGRGLRGPKNGGTPFCRIVTVVDNFGRFSDKLAYHYCQQYFDNMEL